MATAFQPRDVTLRDGRKVHLRAILPTDEEELLQAFDRLGPDARYMRFMTAIGHANVPRLRAVLESFPGKGFAITATVPAADGIDLAGTASCMFLDEPGTCEFAISTVPGWGGAGLGSALMQALVEHARQRGLKRMKGFVLAANQPMLRLATRMGFHLARDPGDFSIRIATLEL
jgi:RimJ/RimL family protein N-acetyltransferase